MLCLHDYVNCAKPNHCNNQKKWSWKQFNFEKSLWLSFILSLVSQKCHGNTFILFFLHLHSSTINMSIKNVYSEYFTVKLLLTICWFSFFVTDLNIIPNLPVLLLFLLLLHLVLHVTKNMALFFAKNCNGNARSYKNVDHLNLYVTFKWWNVHQRDFIITRCLCFSPGRLEWRLQFLLDGGVTRQGHSPYLI